MTFESLPQEDLDLQANFSFDVSLPPLRPEYQLPLVQAVETAVTNPRTRRTILYCPTGGGKTEMAMHICDDELRQGGAVLFIANRIELIEQTSRRFVKAGIDHGIIQGRHRLTDSNQPMQIASIQTLSRRKELPPFTKIIIDEAHGASSLIYRNFISQYPDVPVIGLTATPWSKGLGANLKSLGGEALFQNIVVKVKPADLVRMGFLCDIKAYAPSRPDLADVRIIAGDYDEAQLAAAVDKPSLIADIVDTWHKRANGKRTICFATNIDHSKHIVEEFVRTGVRAEHIDAYTLPEQRTEILNRLRSGETQVISNVSLLSEGFDLPALECMVLARPTRSRIRWFQMIGRVMRPAAGKDFGLLLDHSGSIEELGFPTDDVDLVLDTGKKADKKKKAEKPTKKVCVKCAHVRDANLDTCPACGHKPERVPGNVTVGDGELIELKKCRFPEERRQAIYSALVAYGQGKGYKDGWAWHQYKEMTGQPPGANLRASSGEMIPEVTKWLTYQRIRKAKSQEKAAKTMCKCGSDKIRHKKHIGSSVELTCMSCGNSWFRVGNT